MLGFAEEAPGKQEGCQLKRRGLSGLAEPVGRGYADVPGSHRTRLVGLSWERRVGAENMCEERAGRQLAPTWDAWARPNRPCMWELSPCQALEKPVLGFKVLAYLCHGYDPPDDKKNP